MALCLLSTITTAIEHVQPQRGVAAVLKATSRKGSILIAVRVVCVCGVCVCVCVCAFVIRVVVDEGLRGIIKQSDAGCIVVCSCKCG